MVNVSIIIPCFKRVDQTVQTITLLKKSHGNGELFDLEIIVADASPEDLLKKALEEKFGKEVIYTRPQKIGISANKNQGAKIAKGDILIFCDSDIEVEPETIQNTIKALQENKTVGAVMGQVFWKHGPKEGIHDRPRPEDRTKTRDKTTYIEAIYSRYMATYRDVFVAVGGYDEEVFNMRGEGSDLSLRYWRSGYPLAYDKSIIVHHVFDAPDSAALRIEHPEWGIAKDLLLIAYKYDILDDANQNFSNNVAANFEHLGKKGYYTIIQGIASFMHLIEEVKPIIDKQKEHMQYKYDFKFLEIFSDDTLFSKCLASAEQLITSSRQKAFHES